MKIGIEAQRIFRENKHGMDFVVLEEIRELQKMDTDNEYFVFVKTGPDRCLKESDNVHIIEVNCPTYPLWEQLALPRAAKKHGVKVLHCTSNTAPIFCHIPLVLTLHDIIFLEPRDNKNKSLYQNMGWFYRRLDVPIILKKCKKIITVSEFEYNRIQERLHLPENVLTYIHNGYNKRFRPLSNVEDTCHKYINDNNYFLFLGNTDPKKNTLRTLIAFNKYLKKSKVKRKLLIADLTKDYINRLLIENNIKKAMDYIVTPGYIANSELPYLYNGAYAFLYTSLRESFGIPLLEAMACGTPVITSDTSSMPEIAGEHALLINPEDDEDISRMMIKIENDKNLYNQQKEYGLERAKMFSWQKAAENLLNVYNSVLKQT
jgi:glycosyltransferase involved in cell wall biosynthesis